jgi:hypothetical protein
MAKPKRRPRPDIDGYKCDVHKVRHPAEEMEPYPPGHRWAGRPSRRCKWAHLNRFELGLLKADRVLEAKKRANRANKIAEDSHLAWSKKRFNRVWARQLRAARAQVAAEMVVAIVRVPYEKWQWRKKIA